MREVVKSATLSESVALPQYHRIGRSELVLTEGLSQHSFDETVEEQFLASEIMVLSCTQLFNDLLRTMEGPTKYG